MQNLNTLYTLFTRWVQISREEYIRENQTAVFLNIDITGQGYISDDTGDIYFEFETIRDGIRQLQIT